MKTTQAGSGYFYAILAYIIWGLSPIFWKQLSSLSSIEILVYRVFWSFIFIWLFILIFKVKKDISILKIKWPSVLASGILLALNWIIYIFAVNNGFLQDASLGYYINPLISVFLGMLFLKEKLSRLEWTALACAAAGVIYLSVLLQHIPWISLALAFSFGLYGLFKKRSKLKAVPGLGMELSFIFPFLMIFFFTLMGGINTLEYRVENMSSFTLFVIILSGPFTLVPLALFGKSAGRIKLSAIGFLQFITPTMMLFISTAVFKEPFIIEKFPGFLLVWAGLALYISAKFRKH